MNFHGLVLNDITTTPEAPPQFVAAKPFKGQNDAYPTLRPVTSRLPAAELFKLVDKTARAMPHWEVTVSEAGRLHLEAVVTTPLLKFKDDVAIEVRPTSSGSTLHMRSKSRVGRGDLGTNAARIRDFLDRITSTSS